MLDEFPALGRLDFFESALAFMAGYGLKSFLIAQSLNQIEKAYGPNNSILDNCHVRVSFATNDERTAKRVSDALGTATEMRAMKNYAGHRLSPWLGHLMVSRQETARQLLTPGEIMQLPPTDEIVMVSGRRLSGRRRHATTRMSASANASSRHPSWADPNRTMLTTGVTCSRWPTLKSARISACPSRTMEIRRDRSDIINPNSIMRGQSKKPLRSTMSSRSAPPTTATTTMRFAIGA
jgi:type IV secretion system protein VirD4